MRMLKKHTSRQPSGPAPALATIAEARPGALAPGSVFFPRRQARPDRLPAGASCALRAALVLGGHRRRNDSHAPRDTSDQVLIAAAWSKAAALAEVRAVEPVAIEKPQIAEGVAPSSAPQEAAAGLAAGAR